MQMSVGRYQVWGGLLAVATLGASASAAPRSLNDLTGPWQLFVDDYLIAARQNVVRTYHAFEKHPANPVVPADKPWEGGCIYTYGTILPNEDGKGYRMWYHALPGDHDAYRLLYATSQDGIKWEKPNLGLVDYKGSKDNNIFIRRGKRDHIPSIMHTPWESDPSLHYKMINFDGDAANGYVYAHSADGLHWVDGPGNPVFAKGGDVSQFLWDFHTEQYVGYVKNNANVSGMRRRAVGRTATRDITRWPDPELVLIPDTFDDRWAKGVQRTHFYGMSAFAYETMYLGFLWVFRATDEEGYFDGPIFVELTTSRDGVHWLREEGERPPILPTGPEGTWDDGMITTPTQPLVVDGKVLVFYGGMDVTHAAKPPWHGDVGLGTLRKDGFASLDAAGSDAGVVTTRRMGGARGGLHVNYRANAGGALRVEVIDAKDQVVPGYGRADCAALTGDSLDAVVRWKQRDTLPGGAGGIRLRFILEKASLFSFKTDGTVKVLDDPAGPSLAAVFTFEDGFGDRAKDDGEQGMKRRGDIRVENDAKVAAFGECAVRMTSEFSPVETLEIEGTRELGTDFTLAIAVRSKDQQRARLFSSTTDIGPVRTDELVFEMDPTGSAIPGLQLICKGMEIRSPKLSFADNKYHHLAVTYQDGHITFYLDGKNVGTGLVPGGAPVRMIRNLRVGEDAEHGREEQFLGYLDDVVVLGRCLSSEEVSTLATKGAQSLPVGKPKRKS